MDVSPGLLQLARFRLHRHQGAASKVVVVGSVVRYTTHAIRCHHRKHFTMVGERYGNCYRRTRSRVGRPRLARAAGVLVASRSRTAGDRASLPDVHGDKMGVATFSMDCLDAALRVHQLDSVLLYRVENEARKVASLGTALLCRVRGGRDVWDGKLRKPDMGRCHRPDGSGWHILCGSRICGSQ
jgi:hypothetical protein